MASFSELCHQKLFWGLIIVAYLLTVVSVWEKKIETLKQCFCHIVCLIITLSFYGLASYFYDYFWDSMGYHSHIIGEMANGWNPIYDGDIKDGDRYNDAIWCNYYTKGYELIAACFVVVSGNLQAGKCVNFMLLLACFLSVYNCFSAFFQQYRKGISLIMTVIVVLNPVVINQILTFYIDWLLYVVLLIGICNIYMYSKTKDRQSLLNIGLLCLFVPTIKINIAFYFYILIIFSILIYARSLFKDGALIATIAICSLIGFTVLGCCTYVRNVIEKGSPFYPLVDRLGNNVDIMTINTPSEYIGKSRLYTINHSLIHNPKNDIMQKYENTIIIPHKKNINHSVYPDTRIGGFGILFFESTVLLALSLISFFLKKHEYSENLIKMLLFLGSIYLCLYLLPSGWWARYNCYFYLFPCVIILFLVKKANKGWLLNTAIFMLIIDSGLSICGSILFSYISRQKTEAVVKMLSGLSSVKVSTSNYAFVNLMSDYGIKCQKVDESTCTDLVNFMGPPVFIVVDANNRLAVYRGCDIDVLAGNTKYLVKRDYE